jgi:TolB-like protein/DNA-binding winged helix-turn-helix (wHTH) protein/tetratricopeptide (TPR) repeat protein
MTETAENKRVIYRFGRFEIDPGERLLLCDGEIVPLTPKIFDTLLLLVENNGHTLSKNEIMEKVWADTFVEESNLTSNISRLRKILLMGGCDAIETFAKRGYRFRAEIEKTFKETEVVMTRRVTAHIQTTVDEIAPEEEKLLLPAAPVSFWQKKYFTPALLILILLAVGLTFYFYNRRQTINSLAVLPFKNENGDQTVESFSDGLSESLINRLSRLAQLKVIAQSSSFRFKEKDIDPREVAQTLGVQALVTGSVNQQGDNLIVNVELIDAKDGTRIWSEQYKINVSDAQTVQRQIVRRISDRLHLNLTQTQDEQLAKRDTQSSEAYQLFLNGSLVRRKGGGVENTKKAIEFYNQAITLDPNFALAYVSLANSYRALQFSPGVGDKKEFREKMYQATAKALELDEMLPELHLTLGGIRMDELDWTGAEREYKRAIELNPNYSGAHSGYGSFLSIFERHEEALTEAKLAQELDPLSVANKISVGRTLILARRFDEAIEYLKKIIESEPNNGLAHYYLGFAYVFKGTYDAAFAEYDAANKIRNESPNQFYAFALARAGRKDDALKIIEDVKNKNDYSPAEFAIAYSAVGKNDEAFALLERAFQERDLQLQYLRADPHYDEIRSDPRFQDLVKRVGL